ncbi:MAG: hypothetical protein CME06_07010 [Gemmatimonadetes bacterium]|nr:hypothetical protein [Gemmatimonadota bacterium]
MRRSKLLWPLAALVLARSAAASVPVDINNAGPDEIRALPLPTEVSEALLDRLKYHGAFESFYDLRLVPGLTQDHLLTLRDKVAILPEEGRDLDVQRMDRLYASISRLTAQEGANEALIDNYIDQLRVPITLATASTDRLQSLPGVSPIDAAAIVRHVRGGRPIRSSRDLRSTPDLSHFGWRSVRDYVRYEDEIGRGFGGDAQFRISRPLTMTDNEDLFREDFYAADNDSTYYNQQFVRDAYALLGLDEQQPEVTTKIRGRVGDRWEAGLITHRNAFESDLSGTLKGYLGTKNLSMGPFELEHFVAGNYSLAMGQGLILENTDFYRPRKSGLIFDKRQQGILGDISRTNQHAFQGAAAQLAWGNLRLIGFWSNDERDAILDNAGQVRTLITLNPRIDSDDLPDTLALHPTQLDSNAAFIATDSVDETTWGGSIRFELAPGSHVAVTGYESLYDRFFLPSFDGVIRDDALDNIAPIDNEYLMSNQLEGKFRRVVGGEAQVVWKNAVGQIEYGKQLGAGDAIIATAFAQWSNLNLLLSFRDYDVDYDNPFNRAFSEKERYDDTIFEDPFRLTNPLMAELYVNSAQPAPERGFYGSTRYRLHRMLLATVDYSTWIRKSDGSAFKRIVPRLEFSPTWPLRLQWRHKWQSRNEEGFAETIEISQTIEDRFRLRLFLSDRNGIEFLYHIGHTRWPSRGRLAGTREGGPIYRDADPEENVPLQGSETEPSIALGTVIDHRVNERLKFRAGATAFKGFFWNFEDTEFLVVDGEGTRFWISIWDRLSDNLSLYLKAAWHRENPTNWRDARLYNGEFEFSSQENDAPFELSESTQFRLQLDYTW